MGDARLPLAHIEVGPPHIDGLISEHGWGYPWKFRDKLTDASQPVWQWGIRHDDKIEWSSGLSYPVGQFVRGRDVSPGQDYNNVGFACLTAHTSSSDNEPGLGSDWWTYWVMGGVEINDELKYAAPMGYVIGNEENSQLSVFDLMSPNAEWWREARPRCRYDLPYLHFYKAVAGQRGGAISQWIGQNFFVRVIRFAPVDGEFLVPQFSVGLRATSPEDILHQWQLRLPAHSDQMRYPQLWKYEADATGLPAQAPTMWDELRVGSGSGGSSTDGSFEQLIWLEQIGPYLRITVNGGGGDWTTFVERPDNPGGEAFWFHLSIHTQGHCVMAAAQPLGYPVYAELRPKVYSPIGSGWATTLANRVSKHEPAGTAVAVVTEYDPLNPRSIRPLITFTSDHQNKRAICWRVDTYADAVYQAASGSMATVKFKEVRWKRSDRWRGAEFEGVLHHSESLPTWKGNNKLSLQVAEHPAAGDPTWVPKFTGYIQEPEPGIEDPRVKVTGRTVEIKARDGASARLPKHFMVMSVSPCGWTVGEWFPYVLHLAGVPAALISVDSAVSGIEITDLDPKSEERFLYGHDQGVIQALDEVLVDNLGLIWGNDVDGSYFVKRRPTWTSGDTPDWTLDEDTTSEQDYIFSFSASRTDDEFRNYILGITRTMSPSQFALYIDTGSHRTEADDRYIGEDCWKILVTADGDSAPVVAAREFLERQRLTHLIVWETGLTALNPDEFVKVQVANMNIPTDSVFQIISERGFVRGTEAKTEFVGSVVEYGP